MDRPRDRRALIEVHERDGRTLRLVDVEDWPLTIGRALDNDLVIDDPHVAAHHARLDGDANGALTLNVLDSVNGVVTGRRRVGAGTPLPLPADGAMLQLGATRLRLRLPAEVLAPEKPLPALARGHLTLPLLAGAALLALQSATQWLHLDPGADYSAWLPLLVGLPVALGAWCGLWALLSKLFQHRFDFAGHLRIALPWLLALGLAEALWPQLAAMLAAPALWQLTQPLQALLLALLVRAHLQHMLPQHGRAVTLAVATTALVGGGIALALTQRAHDSLSSAPYMSTLPLPSLRLAGTVPSVQLIDAMAPLAERLEKRAKQARDDEAEDGGDSGD